MLPPLQSVPLDITSAAIQCDYVRISQDGSRLHRCVCMRVFIYMYGRPCGYVCGRVDMLPGSLLQRDKIFSSCDHLVRVSFIPSECKFLPRDLFDLLRPWSRTIAAKSDTIPINKSLHNSIIMNLSIKFDTMFFSDVLDNRYSTISHTISIKRAVIAFWDFRSIIRFIINILDQTRKKEREHELWQIIE